MFRGNWIFFLKCCCSKIISYKVHIICVFTVSIFYPQIILDMASLDISCSCKLYTRVGYLCSHCFFTLNISEIHMIPRQYVQNRWLKKAELRFSTLELDNNPVPKSNLDDCKAKTKHCWFEFQGCICDASGNSVLVNFIHDGLRAMRLKMKEMLKDGTCEVDDGCVEDIFGTKNVEDNSVMPPNISNNKGSRKRIMSSTEKSIGCKKRNKRKCKACGEMAFHDSRNCPNKDESV